MLLPIGLNLHLGPISNFRMGPGYFRANFTDRRFRLKIYVENNSNVDSLQRRIRSAKDTCNHISVRDYLTFLPVVNEVLFSGALRPLCFEVSRKDLSSLTMSGCL